LAEYSYGFSLLEQHHKKSTILVTNFVELLFDENLGKDVFYSVKFYFCSRLATFV
jgi:hypothetical protein